MSSRVDREREGRPWYRKRWLLVLGLLILLPGLCCFVSYQLTILNDFYFLVFGRHYYDRAIALIPEFDRLNDQLMTRLPLYPDAVLLPEEQRRSGPGANEFPVAPGGPRVLSFTYVSNDSMEAIIGFFKSELAERGWKLARVVEYAPVQFTWIFAKDSACIDISYWPTEVDKLPPGYRTFYEVRVYYDLNVLLGFPGVPNGGCP
jgi:hypothetical protein